MPSAPRKRARSVDDAVVGKTVKLASAWDRFLDDAEAIVGRVVRAEAITEKGVTALHRAIAADLAKDSYAPAARGEDSVAACGRKTTVVRALIGLLLSTGTTIETSACTQARLWAAWPGGPNELVEDFLRDPTGTKAKVERAIRKGGFARRRADDICGLLSTLHETNRDDTDAALEHLRNDPADTSRITRALEKFKGVGPKIAVCVAAFTIGSKLCTVDTNVKTMAHALGWFARDRGPEEMQRLLNGAAGSPFAVPETTAARDDARVALHCVLMQLGIMRRRDAHSRAAVDAFVETWKTRRAELAGGV